MDLFKGIQAIILIVIFVCSGTISGQLYLQPNDAQHGYFTGDSFFVICFTPNTEKTNLRWDDTESNTIGDSTDQRIHVQPAGGDSQGLTLMFLSLEREDSGTYTCSDDMDSVSFELTVTRSISFGDTPEVQHAPEGDNALIICHVKHDVSTVQWLDTKGKKITNGDKYEIEGNRGLKIFNLSRYDAGNYTCQPILVTAFGSQIKKLPIKLQVQYSPEIVGEPRITKYARIGSVVQLVCNITADPYPIFQWLRDEMMIYNETNDIYMFHTHNSSVLQLNLRGEEDLGVYICRASNSMGEEELTVDLKVGNPPPAPKLSVKDHKEDGVLKLHIEPAKDADEEELKTIGYKVEFTLANDETFDNADSHEFKIEEPHVIRNLSVDSEYLFRAAALNRAGYSEYSEHVRHKTKSQPEKAPVVASASGIVASTLVLFTSIVFFRLF